MASGIFLRDNRRGMYIMTPFMGVVMILIVFAVSYYIGSEANQQMELAGASTLNDELLFISQSIQADFFDLLMQNILESEAVKFLQSKTHVLYPTADFSSNIGNDFRLALEEPLAYIVNEDTSETYSKAYSSLPAITCNPKSSEAGSLSYINFDENEDGTLTISAVTTGQEIECISTEPPGRTQIALQGRGYQLSVRAVAIHDAAIRAINDVYSQLNDMESTYTQEQWAYPMEEKALDKIVENWNSMIRGLSSTSLLSGSDGLYLDPGSVQIFSGDGDQFSVNDFTISCGGEAGYDGSRNCRPDEVGLDISEEQERCDEVSKISLKAELGEITITTPGGTVLKVDTKNLEEELRKALEDMTSDMQGCLSYSGSTKICKEWVGRPGSVLVRGVILEANSGYIPSGVEAPINFEFVSTGFGLDQPEFEDDLECDSEENKDLVMDNIKAILVSGEGFELNIQPVEDKQGQKRFDITNLEDLAEKINQDPMYENTGAKITLNTNLKIPVPQSQGPPPGDNGGTPPPETLEITGSVEGSKGPVSEKAAQDTEMLATGELKGAGAEEMKEAFKSGDVYERYGSVHSVLDNAASAANTVGDTRSATALSKSSGSVCKMMGMRHGMETGDMNLAIQALCGIVSTSLDQNLAPICGLGQLWAAFESGDLKGYNLAVSGLMQQMGFGPMNVNPELLRQGLETGNIGLSLQGIASTLSSSASVYLGNVASLMSALEAGDSRGALGISANIMGMYGGSNSVNILQSISGLDLAVQGGDTQAALNGMIGLANVYGVGDLGNLAFMANVGSMSKTQALATIGSTVLPGYGDMMGLFGLQNLGGTMNLDMDLRGLSAKCKKVNPLAYLCLAGGGVCPLQHEDCVFSGGLPTFDLNMLCTDLSSAGGFRLSCQCSYICTKAPYTRVFTSSADISIGGLAASMNLEGMAPILQMVSMKDAISRQRNVQYCKYDP
ncbi:MAG: hypothetical protein JXB14_04400 [Candidatus Altiarchaeota archaeon]|nr:hypothetical protein [Candidatus Altiarchaeota archaeon]